MVAASVIATPLCRSLRAQTSRATENAADGIVRGTITAKLSGFLLARAVVTIESLGLQQFSNDQGKFFFVKVPPGTYTLNIRQLGYQPVNTQVTVGTTGAADVAVQMERIATKLTAFAVNAQQTCEQPGRPTAADGPQLDAMFEQLEQNAVRLGLLAKAYPYVVFFERRVIRRETSGKDVVEPSQVLTVPGQHKSEYESGRVVRRIGSAWSLQIPTLLDFADAEFVANHCFFLRGVETLGADAGGDGSAVVRVDFAASSALVEPDVEGSVLLDTADFRLRRTEIRLSKLPARLPEIAAVRVVTTFQDFVPGMPMINLLSAETELQRVGGKAFKVQSRTEQQIISNIMFLKQRPDSANVPKKPGS